MNSIFPLDSKRALLWMVALIAIVSVFQTPPMSQDQLYHSFSDQGKSLGISNFYNVLSNIPFLIVGILGFVLFFKNKSKLQELGVFIPSIVFATGIFCVGIGSAYYHYNPNNETLIWDRLPMTIGFMALYSIIVSTFIHPSSGNKLLPWLLFCGLFSVGYWGFTESIDAGDLRMYALVQFLPMVLILFILSLYTTQKVGQGKLMIVLIWYAIAKALETFDEQIFSILDNNISGHSLKHIAAAIASYYVIVWICNLHKILK
jgi:hypothetical protein